MWIYVWSSKIKDLKIWTATPSAVYLWDTKVRPSIINWATQWPCQDGFHVPLQSELQTVYNTGWCSYLKLPLTWRRDFWGGWITSQGRYWYYWSSSSYSDARWAYFLRDESWYVITWSGKAYWFSIRPFKNIPVQPDSSWTVLYQGSWNAWVYHNTSLGLISLSTNWTTRITIADKNLWATTVYNSWDTLSEANCGKYYQRWNNYGFPFTWSITTSSTQVNASAYWPWNYYSSSTFITITSNWAWDSTGNKNLRWWEDGNVPV